MTRPKVECGIDFADGEVSSYERTEESFYVVVRKWDHTLLRITFEDTVAVLDHGVGDIMEFCQETSASAFLLEALARQYVEVPAEHPYVLYQFLDVDREPALEVVAAGYSIARQE
jgi:hypothetical protein